MNTLIQQSNPLQIYLNYQEEINLAIEDVLKSGWYVLGKSVETFEKNLAIYNDATRAVGCANGTDAIELALRALDIGVGDHVVTVSHTAVATIAAIRRCGAIPIFVDIDPEDYNLDPEKLEEFLAANPDKSIKAIVCVHIYGQPANIIAIKKIAKEHNLHLIEDCAQAIGASVSGNKVGTFGAAGTFSFYPTKNLGAFGDGGAIITNSDALAEKVVSLRQYGWVERYISEFEGINSRLDELQAAILDVLLKKLEKSTEHRVAVANHYHQLCNAKGLKTQSTRKGSQHVFHQFVFETENRDDIITKFKDRGICLGIHYPVPVHLQGAYKQFSKPLPITESVSKKIVSLPMHAGLNEQDLETIANAFDRVF